MTLCPPEVPFLTPDQMLTFKTSSAGARRIVTQRGDDLLTPEETEQRWPGVEAVMLKELLTWAKLKCFSRKPKHMTRNIIGV